MKYLPQTRLPTNNNNNSQPHQNFSNKENFSVMHCLVYLLSESGCGWRRLNCLLYDNSFRDNFLFDNHLWNNTFLVDHPWYNFFFVNNLWLLRHCLLCLMGTTETSSSIREKAKIEKFTIIEASSWLLAPSRLYVCLSLWLCVCLVLWYFNTFFYC